MNLVEKGMEGIHVKGWRVALKNGMVEDGSGGKTWRVRVLGVVEDDEPATVGGEENTKRARCFGMFQFLRPL